MILLNLKHIAYIMSLCGEEQNTSLLSRSLPCDRYCKLCPWYNSPDCISYVQRERLQLGQCDTSVYYTFIVCCCRPCASLYLPIAVTHVHIEFSHGCRQGGALNEALPVRAPLLYRAERSQLSEWVSSVLRPRQHSIGYRRAISADIRRRQ